MRPRRASQGPHKTSQAIFELWHHIVGAAVEHHLNDVSQARAKINDRLSMATHQTQPLTTTT